MLPCYPEQPVPSWPSGFSIAEVEILGELAARVGEDEEIELVSAGFEVVELLCDVGVNACPAVASLARQKVRV